MEINKDFDKKNLKELFNLAMEKDMEYIAVEVENSDYKKPEIIINKKENFEDKFKYYLEAYDDNLVLKNCSKIKIKNIIFSKNLKGIFSKIK